MNTARRHAHLLACPCGGGTGLGCPRCDPSPSWGVVTHYHASVYPRRMARRVRAVRKVMARTARESE